jgi:hypothetical protein
MRGLRRRPSREHQFEPPRQVLANYGAMRVGQPGSGQSLGRRDAPLDYKRLFVPSLVIDHTETMLRRYGNCGEEGIGLWAGSQGGGDGFVSTLITPSVSSHGRFHGELSAETMAAVLSRLDHLDLLLLAQIHSHPRAAFLSDIDSERPAIAVPGFLSIIVPDFGFVDVADVGTWGGV